MKQRSAVQRKVIGSYSTNMLLFLLGAQRYISGLNTTQAVTLPPLARRTLTPGTRSLPSCRLFGMRTMNNKVQKYRFGCFVRLLPVS